LLPAHSVRSTCRRGGGRVAGTGGGRRGGCGAAACREARVTGTRPHGLSAHLFVRDADGAVAFYREAFGAAEVFRNRLPDGTLLFVEVVLGAGRLLISEETPSLDALAPPTIGGTPVLLHLEVDDV